MPGFEAYISSNKDTLGKRGAAFAADVIRTTIAEKGSARIIIATGASQFEFLHHLVGEPGVPWDKVTAFHLDEYVGMDENHKASFRGYLNERFFNLVQPPCKEVNLLGGPTGKLDEAQAKVACEAYGKKLLEGDIDIACIGIGENGHIAFNDPPVADFNDPLMVKVVPLDEKCRRQQLGEGWFPTFDDVPTHAMSLTCTAIMRCKIISVHVPDDRKSEAVKNTISAEVSTACPATLLRQHANCKLWLDEPSAARLTAADKKLVPVAGEFECRIMDNLVDQVRELTLENAQLKAAQ